MKLYKLLYGKSKKRMKPIMIDSREKCENYKASREHNIDGWHEIIPADPDSMTWRQKTATVGGNKYEHGKNNGYIGKNGFNHHT